MYDNTSSKADNRELKSWYNMVKEGQIKLPRFQRDGDAWDKKRITSFLNTIVTNLPVGITLVLRVDDGKEQFVSRYIETADRKGSPRVTEHLLDGQQRITALWRSMNDNYSSESYFIYIPEYDEENSNQAAGEIEVKCQYRYYKDDQPYPLWANCPEKSFRKGLFPLKLFRPEDILSEMTSWVDNATDKFLSGEEAFSSREYKDFCSKLEGKLNSIREAISHYNLPFLSLPTSTKRGVALKVFTDMNTNSKPLSQFDIIKAEVEHKTGKSLDDLLKSLDLKHPKVRRYFDAGDLLLSTAALLQGKVPNRKGIFNTDLPTMIDDWERLESCLGNMADFMEANGVYDKGRLPTNAVLGVVAACYADIPAHGDKRGCLENLLKKYVWSAFFTDRYENSAPTGAYADYIALRKIIIDLDVHNVDNPVSQGVPIFDRKRYPLPDIEQLLIVGWPKRANIRARAILAVSTLLGASDFADGQKITSQNIKNRHYHHIYPLSLFEELGIKKEKYDVALNCALITDKTNQEIGRKDPYDYLLDRYKWVSEGVVQERLHSHLIPINELKTGTYCDLGEEAKIEKIKIDFDSFLRARASLLLKAIDKLVSGQEISIDNLFNERKEDKVEIIKGLISSNENKEVEYKASLRECVQGNVPQHILEHSVFKNVNAFMNSNGGNLLIGIEDSTKKILGLDRDYVSFKSADKRDAFLKHMDNLLEHMFGNSVASIFRVDIESIHNKDVALLTVDKSIKPVWLKNKKEKKEEFFIRRNGSAKSLNPEETQSYIKQHW